VILDIKDITSFKWATVIAVSPVRIKLDGDTSTLALTPESLIDPLLLAVNDRVRVELSLRKVVIHGKSSGSRFPGRLGVANNLGAGIDPSNITETGWYSGYAWVGSLAGQSIGTLQVIQYSPDWISQTFTTVEAAPKMYIRSRYSGTTWGKWQLVTTVAQAF
jgi:hypothetical protein